MDTSSPPDSLDPAKVAEKVTRELTARLAELADSLEADDHPPDAVATFLMCCLSTMFAEDVGLLPRRTLADMIEKSWLPEPASFPGGIELLWRTVGDGGLFRQPSVLPLTKAQLAMLLEASRSSWADVELTIFGTLLERALNPRERHQLGAHFTPRAYIERLVRPTLEEPLRAEWELVRAEVRQLMASNGKKLEVARGLVRAFHQRLCKVRVLDPACGSGNFLYVSMELIQRLEGEVLELLAALGEGQTLLEAGGVTVSPAQFHGIEVNRWAGEIAELVLWIGHLRWQSRTRSGADGKAPRTIEYRDAILAWHGGPDKRHPVKAEWPPADFIVGNPPFIANKNMRMFLGGGYVDALKVAYPEIREAADYVMFFWSRATKLVAEGRVIRSGLITTNSIRMIQNQGVVRRALASGARLVFAIPDHPWPAGSGSAEVRISMTVVASDKAPGRPRLVLTPIHDTVARGRNRVGEVAESGLRSVRCRDIAPDLSPHLNVSAVVELRSNQGLCHAGMKPYARTLVISPELARALIPDPRQRARYAPRYRNGQDVGQVPRGVHVLDLHGLSERDVQTKLPEVYQYVLNNTRPERSQERNPRLRDAWWLFEASRPELRLALRGLERYIVTVESSPVRIFTFLEGDILPDQKLRVIASEDAYLLAVLSSRPHRVFSARLGGRQGVRNTPVYNSRCFTHFPFPGCTPGLQQELRRLGESLEAQRRRQQSLHAHLGLTGMYNVIEKMRTGEPLSRQERLVQEQGLVSVLEQVHDEIDAMVLAAYGWAEEITDEQVLESLVALNAERAGEERGGLVRRLRPLPARPAVIQPTSPPRGDCAPASAPGSGGS
jgi:hypothetical protein